MGEILFFILFLVYIIIILGDLVCLYLLINDGGTQPLKDSLTSRSD